MKEHRLIGIIAATVLALCATGWARAQTQPPGTRATACDPLTPNNALCLTWTAPATNTDGTPTVLPLVYRVEQQFNGGATWTQAATGLTSTRYYAKNLALGTYVFRVYANCTGNAGCTEGAPTASNSKDSTAPVIQPGPPASVLVVQVTITSDHAPVYRVIGTANRYTRGEMFGLVPVGRECIGTALFRYRGKSFYFVHVQPEEVWGTTDTSRLSAPCS